MLNVSVPLFIFLSGLLTKVDNDDWMAFFKKRIRYEDCLYAVRGRFAKCADTLDHKSTLFFPLGAFADKRRYRLYERIACG